MSSRYHELYQDYRVLLRALRRIADTTDVNGQAQGKWHSKCIGIAKEAIAQVDPTPTPNSTTLLSAVSAEGE